MGQELRTKEDIEAHILSFFTQMFTSGQCVIEESFTSENRIKCSHIPSLLEIKEALFSIRSSKAPRHAIMFQKFWEIIASDFLSQIQLILQNKCVPDSMNKAAIVLIPKISQNVKITNFRPISLINTCYKVVTKILVQRIKPHLQLIISPYQQSFIPGRRCDTNFIVASQILHSMKKKKGKKDFFAIKLDLEKAYDRLEWPFIQLCLQFFNFDQDTISLIMSCVSSGSSSILINGNPSKSFKPSRGIRQGDPLSPYLFILCMEFLS